MGRPKVYTTHAAQQAAYRQRLRTDTVVVNRKSLDQLEERLNTLHFAILRAKQDGNPLARTVGFASVDTTLDALTAWFNQRGEEGRTSRK